MRKIMSLLMAVLVITLVTSCKDDDNGGNVTPPSVAELISANDDYSSLEAALKKADLYEILNGNSPFTLFAPDNDAFAELLTALQATSLDDIPDEVLVSVLTYHVVEGTVFSKDLASTDYETVNGATINIDLSNGVVINGSANVIAPFDQTARNGAIHTIDEVLLPPTPSVVDIISNSSDHTVLLAALTKFPDLVSTIANGTEQTIFAPTDAAFVDLLAAIGQTELDDVPEDVLRTILENHVIAGANILSSDLTDGQEATTAGGESVGVTINGDGVFIEGARVSSPDVTGSNGIIHITDGVLVPRSVSPVVNTIVAPAFFNREFSILIAAVKAADEDILSVLLGNGPSGNGITLFAPNDDAFAAAGITTLPDPATLSAVLKYHVIDGTVMAMDIPAGSSSAPTLNGDIYLSNGAGGVFINGTTQVVATDLTRDNGVVHLIDQVLLPPSQNIVEIALDLGFNKLAEAVIEAGLDGVLSGEGDFTVFAPSDAAFEALYTALGVDGPEDIDDALLEDVLLYHVLGARVFSTDLEDGLVASTLSDISSPTTFTVSIDGGVSIVDNDPDFTDPNVVVTNVLATNGVIHAIDAVMIPVDL